MYYCIVWSEQFQLYSLLEQVYKDTRSRWAWYMDRCFPIGNRRDDRWVVKKKILRRHQQTTRNTP
jgi:hypothetical protein